MRDDVVIRVSGLSKKYLIGHNTVRDGYSTLREIISGQARAFVRSTTDLMRGTPNIAGDEIEEFWALKDLNFEVRRGEVVGVIGRNGAGKSTLLKVLSRITEPTDGRVEIRGRVATLLEVGTGFHPELSGRENIFLNGAVLGMTRSEIRRKFDEIVAFAEVDKFLDTPVKRYSSGMYVRLAFAVAAHLEPEILIIDEVLAVGDIEFQKKCLGKMSQVAGDGRTIIFVSHNMPSVAALCQTGVWLSDGRIAAHDEVARVLESYLSASTATSTDRAAGVLYSSATAQSNASPRILRVEMLDGEGHMTTVFDHAASMHIRLTIAVRPGERDVAALVYLCSSDGRKLAKFETDPNKVRIQGIGDSIVVACSIAAVPLLPGQYSLSCGIAEYGVRILELLEDLGPFTIAASEAVLSLTGRYPEGVITLAHTWALD
jgi:lipopolysaccharide transport system ATP-binding protein